MRECCERLIERAEGSSVRRLQDADREDNEQLNGRAGRSIMRWLTEAALTER